MGSGDESSPGRFLMATSRRHSRRQSRESWCELRGWWRGLAGRRLAPRDWGHDPRFVRPNTEIFWPAHGCVAGLMYSRAKPPPKYSQSFSSPKLSSPSSPTNSRATAWRAEALDYIPPPRGDIISASPAPRVGGVNIALFPANPRLHAIGSPHFSRSTADA